MHIYAGPNSFENPIRYRPRYRTKPHNHQTIRDIFALKSLWQLQKFVLPNQGLPDQGENRCRQESWKKLPMGDDRCQWHSPVRHPSRDTTTKRFLYMTQVVIEHVAFCEFRSELLSTYLKRTFKGIHWLSALWICFYLFFYEVRSTSFGRFCIFPDRWIGYITRYLVYIYFEVYIYEVIYVYIIYIPGIYLRSIY